LRSISIAATSGCRPELDRDRAALGLDDAVALALER
jgi:hypothetical protein